MSTHLSPSEERQLKFLKDNGQAWDSNQSINQSEGIYIAPNSTKVVQRRSRQLDEVNVDTLVGIENN